MVRRVMGRTAYDTDEERQAETFAHVTGERIGLRSRRWMRRHTNPDPIVLAQCGRLTMALQHPADRSTPSRPSRNDARCLH